MKRRGIRILLAVLVAGALVVGACLALLPERFAVNVPLANALFGRGVELAEDHVLARLRVPEGFFVTRYATGLPNARMLAFTPMGDLLVSQPRHGQVALLEPDADGDGRSDATRVLLTGFASPHGIAWHEGFLYVAEAASVGRLRYDPAARRAGAFERIITDIPEGGNHWTRTVHVGPDGGLYVSVGSSCNVCIEDDPRRATLLRYERDGRNEEIFASGLRNAVDFAWHPTTGDLYATDNGRDLLGDDFPPDELNRVERGGFYGWPFASGARVPDPDFGTGHPERVAASLPPVHAFGAHNAALGITFLSDAAFPPEYASAAAVALHGSWNRTRKDGYAVVSLHWRPDGSIDEHDLLWGFEENEDVVGRPVGVAVGPDGALYVSDDYGGSIFRVSHGTAPRPPLRQTAPAPTPVKPTVGEPDPSQVARGAELFGRHRCLTCHDPRRPMPGMVPKALDGVGRRLGRADIVSLLATPPPPMPRFPLSESEREDLAAYLRATYP